MCFSLVSINKTFLKIKATLDIALFFHLHYFFFKLSFIPNNLSILPPTIVTFTTIHMPNIQQQTSDDRFLVIALKQDDKQAFTRLFHAYYKDLVLFGGTYIPEKSTCEDIVQNIFLKLWNDRKSLVIEKLTKIIFTESGQGITVWTNYAIAGL